jgi:hypothetical protein
VRQPRALSTHDPQALTELPIFCANINNPAPLRARHRPVPVSGFRGAPGAEMEQFGVKGINVM